MNSFAAAAALLCLAYSVVPALGIKCYTCSGTSCQDPLNLKGYEVECTPDLARKALTGIKNTVNQFASSLGINTNVDTGDIKMGCLKIRSKSDDESAETITRSCALLSDKSDICELSKQTVGDKYLGCSACDTELCNGGTSIHLSAALVALTAVIFLAIGR